MLKINKRYKDIFEAYIHKDEPTPFTIGTFVVCILCFILLIIATFTQITFSHPWLEYVENVGFTYTTKVITYSPQFPVIIFITYILYKGYSIFVYLLYLLTGFFLYPVFAFGGGFEYVQNYFFGYLVGFIFAIFITSKIFEKSTTIKSRLLASVYGILSIHIVGFIYCVFLALFGAIDFNLLGPIFYVVTVTKIIYDILFTILILLIVPYIKNIFWVFMRPLSSGKKLENSNKRNKIVRNKFYQHGQDND